MEDVVFLSLEQVCRLHQRCLEEFGGSDGVRDYGLLDSAIAMPQARYAGQYLHADLYEMAAAYLFHICRNHAFVDGNKRVAVATAEIFLRLNGREMTASDDALEKLTLETACGQQDKVQIARFLREHTRPDQP